MEHYFTWIRSGQFQVGWDFSADRLTGIMLLVITGIGSLIHFYSVGYMSHDSSYSRFFAYLNLFMFFMLTLVLASNYLLLFIGWEGVGLASYLLVGYWYTKKSATDAGNKAFIVNRIGDFGFMLAMLLIVINFGTLDFATVMTAAPGKAAITLTAICLLVAWSGRAESPRNSPFMFGLPDAMEGPTPVSALIHAATMVTAGIYVVARGLPLCFHTRPPHRKWSPISVCFTAIFAASIGLATKRYQEDFCLLYGVAAGLYVCRSWCRSLFSQCLAPDDARLLQSTSLPGCRKRDPCVFGRTGHSQDGWPAFENADHVHHLDLRGSRHLRHPSVLRLLQ